MDKLGIQPDKPWPRPDRTTDKWIDELKNKTITNGSLLAGDYDCNYYINYNPKYSNGIDLTGEFTIEQLEALIKHMKKYNT